MTLEELLEQYGRNYTEEKEILENFSKILKPIYSKKEIENVLEENGFNGVYLVDDEHFKPLACDADGIYEHEKRVIVMKQSSYISDNKLGIHEMGHAFLNGKSNKQIKIDNRVLTYGNGLEEGAMSLLMHTSTVYDISKTSRYDYYCQSILFQQLNELYEYSGLKTYPNLLVYLLKEPESFISLIWDIYKNIYESSGLKPDKLIISKCTFDMIEGSDILADCIFDGRLYGLLQKMNAIYVCLADKKRRKESIKGDLFFVPKVCLETKEEILLSQLFGISGYANRLQEEIKSLLVLLQENFEEHSIDEKRKRLIG